MEFGIIELLAGVALLFLAVYYYLMSNYDFWEKRGVKGPKPVPPFGNFKDLMFNNLHLCQYVMKLFEEFKNEPMIGVFARKTPILILKDPECIKNVMIKDFTVFSERGVPLHEEVEPLNQHLLFLETERWRPLRHKLSPTFTSGKLKEMFYLLMECADHFEEFLDKIVAKKSELECRDLTAKFTTDAIGVCAFGLNMNSISEEESDFRKFGRKFFEISGIRSLKFKIREISPWLYRILKPWTCEYELNNFFINTMKETMEFRKKNNIKRNDFVDLLMEIKDNPDKTNNIELTDTLITAQAFVFFIAGFETSSSTMSNALLELAANQSIQNKLREEVKEKLKENNGKLTFDSIKSMKYMHKVFYETLRKYPPVTTLVRCSVDEYTFPGTNVTIPKKTQIWIPAYALQRDPDIYPDPETFDPERFDEEKIKQRHPAYFLPFGDGPRNCIGSRFGHCQSKIGLATILKNFRVDVCDKTRIPYTPNPRTFLLAPKDGIILKFTKLH